MGLIVGGLEAEKFDRSYPTAYLIKRIWRYIRLQQRRAILIIAMMIVTACNGAAFPVIISAAINNLYNAESGGNVVLIIGLYLLLSLLDWICNFYRQIYVTKVVGSLANQLRIDVFYAAVNHDMKFYDGNALGSIVNRITSDTDDLTTVVTLLINLFGVILEVSFISVVLLSIDTKLTLLTFTIAPVIILTTLGFRSIARRIIQQFQRARASVNAVVQESLGGIAIAKNYCQEHMLYQEFSNANAQLYRANLFTGITYNGIWPIIITLGGIGTIIVVYFGGISVQQGEISLGSWYLFVSTINMFWFPFTSIASFWSQFQQGLSASERIFSMMDVAPEAQQSAHEPVPSMSGAVEFQDVTFGYNPDHPVMNQFSLLIPAGQKLAVVGHTGSGKSSLVRLIMRFYEFQSGKLLIDGRDIRTLDLTQYRQQIGFVPQQPLLFKGTVLDNIRYGRPTASEQDVADAALMLGPDWIDNLPCGLQSEVGEHGARLSLGQRQLVALARVLLQNPSLFILDEATASIDPFTEAQIQAGLNIVMQNRTSIMIAHRLSTVQQADRILVMSTGRILEQGTHQELLARGGHYNTLYQTYFNYQEHLSDMA